MNSFIKSLIDSIFSAKGDLEDAASSLGKGVANALREQLYSWQLTKYFGDQSDKIARQAAASYTKLVKDLNKAGQAYKENIKVIDSSYKELKEQIRTGSVPEVPKSALKSLADAYSENSKTILKGHRDNLDTLNLEYRNSIDSIYSAKRSLSDKISGFAGSFQNPKRDKAYSAEKIMENSGRSAAQVKEFYVLIERLRKRNVPKELIEELTAMGPAAAPQVREFLKLTDSQLKEYAKNQSASKIYGDKLADAQYADELKKAKDLYRQSVDEEKDRYNLEIAILKETYNKEAKELLERQKKQYAQAKKEYDKQIAAEKKRYEAEQKNIINRTRHYMADLGRVIKDGLKRGTFLSEWEINQIADNLTKGVIESVKDKLKNQSKAAKSSTKYQGEPFLVKSKEELQSKLKQQAAALSADKISLGTMNFIKSQPYGTPPNASGVSQNNSSTVFENEFNFYQSVETPDQVARAVNRVLTHGLAGDK